MIGRLVVFLLAAVVALSAYAQTCTEYIVGITSNGSAANSVGMLGQQWSTSQSGALASYCAAIGKEACYFKTGWGSQVNYPCPEGTCTSGVPAVYTRTGTCTPGSLCAGWAGQSWTRNITLGYQGSDPDGGVARAEYKPDGSANPTGEWSVPPQLCINNCIVTTGEGGGFWQSANPTSAGMYRISRDYTFTVTATECSPQMQDASKNLVDGTQAAPSTCPGFQGYVNGRPACVPKVETTGTAPGAGQSVKTGNPTAGSDPENPARIPEVNGDGGNKGGPPHPKDGYTRTPDGTVVSPSESTSETGTKTSVEGEEQLACGAPGQPKCKIDESGTPTGQGASDNLKQAIDALQSAQASQIGGAASKTLPAWTWTFAIPTGCTPFVMAAFNFTVDVCAWQSMIHGLMAMVWLTITIWACVGMVGRTVRGGV